MFKRSITHDEDDVDDNCVDNDAGDARFVLLILKKRSVAVKVVFNTVVIRRNNTLIHHILNKPIPALSPVVLPLRGMIFGPIKSRKGISLEESIVFAEIL